MHHREHRRHRNKFNVLANSFSVFSVKKPLAEGIINESFSQLSDNSITRSANGSLSVVNKSIGSYQ
jgi:hypothetical protein